MKAETLKRLEEKTESMSAVLVAPSELFDLLNRLKAAERVCAAAELDLDNGDWRPMVEALAAWRREL